MARKGNQLYAVIYEGTDPQTGRQRRRWHPQAPTAWRPRNWLTSWPPPLSIDGKLSKGVS